MFLHVAKSHPPLAALLAAAFALTGIANAQTPPTKADAHPAQETAVDAAKQATKDPMTVKPPATLQQQPGQLTPGGIKGMPQPGGMAPQPGGMAAHGAPAAAAPELGKEPPAFSGAGIVFDTPRYNFGRIMAGGAVKHEYWFTNTGKEKLQILAVQPGCGCTTAGAWDREVPPGESGRIPISMNTGKFSGKMTKAITVTTNVKEVPSLQLHIEGDLWQPVQVTPSNIAFGQLTGDKLKEAQVVEAVIENNTDSPLELKAVKCSNQIIRAEYTPETPGKKWKLKVSALPPFPTGNFYADIKIETSSPAVPEISVIASGYVPTPVQVFPPVVALRAIQDAGYEQQITVRNNSGAPMKVLEITCTDDKLKFTSTEQASNTGYTLAMKVPEKYVAPQGGAQITIKTDAKGAELLTVKVFQNATPNVPGFAGQKPMTPPVAGGAAQPGMVKPVAPGTPAGPGPAGPASPAKPAQPVPTSPN